MGWISGEFLRAAYEIAAGGGDLSLSRPSITGSAPNAGFDPGG